MYLVLANLQSVKSMNRDQLFKKLSKPISKNETVQMALNKDCTSKDLIELSLHPLNELAFRSSWILEQLFYFRRDSFLISIEDFLHAYFQQKNQSCQRHFTKIMMSLTEAKSNKISFDWIVENQDEIIETTFDWFIKIDTPIAVIVNCMDILWHLSNSQAWIVGELRSQVQFLLKDGSAAVQSRGKRILKKLNS